MSSALVFLHSGLNNRTRHKQLDKDNMKQRKLTIDTPIQSLVLSMHTLTIQLYMSQHMSTKNSITSYTAAKHLKRSKLRVTNIRKEPVNFFKVPNECLL